MSKRTGRNALMTETFVAGVMVVNEPSQARGIGSRSWSARFRPTAFPVSISNAMAAPGFKPGSTSPDLWRTSLKSAPAPYAELMSDRVILSIPSEWIRGIADLTTLRQQGNWGWFHELGHEAKRDEFLVRLSGQVKHDLYPFLHGVWGLELGEDARKKVAELKPWLPDGFTVQ